ncbi:Uncharacterised protein [Mycobacteroides abscessus subsp. abscessus]|nr:Uncharacterised protein [Mycobacteroides abscessus subsp. abscessus]
MPECCLRGPADDPVVPGLLDRAPDNPMQIGQHRRPGRRRLVLLRIVGSRRCGAVFRRSGVVGLTCRRSAPRGVGRIERLAFVSQRKIHRHRRRPTRCSAHAFSESRRRGGVVGHRNRVAACRGYGSSIPDRRRLRATHPLPRVTKPITRLTSTAVSGERRVGASR